MGNVQENLARVRERIATAASRCGRDPGEINLVAATKYATIEQVREAIAGGVEIVGENRVQDAVKKFAALGPVVSWHFIGHLQKNKVKDMIDWIELVHSLDRLPLARELQKRAEKANRTVNVLVQVNVAGEESKSGLAGGEVESFLEELSAFPRLRVWGLMTIAPYVADPETVRPVFRQLRELADRLPRLPQVEMRYLSMGMSQDLEVAISEGSNMVRVGQAIFGT